MSDIINVATAASKIAQWLLLLLALLLAGPLATVAIGRASLAGDWRTATHRPAGLAPDPATHPDAIVQVYAGRAFGWRGAFSDHTWLAAKPKGATTYTRYEVIGWYGGSGRSVVSIGSSRAPDAEWYGAAPRIVRDIRGTQAEAVIDAVGSPAGSPELAAKAKEIYDSINDILSEMRNNMVLVQGELPNLTADAETLQAVGDAVEALVDSAETAKGALRGLRDLAESK